MSEGILRVGEPRPAGFWIRAAAFVVDLVIIWFVQLSFGFIARLRYGVEIERTWSLRAAVVFFTLLFMAAYTTFLHAWLGQTVGKSLAGVRVVATDGRGLTVGPALLRHLGYCVSLVPFGFGYIMAGLRRDKRALHDLIAGTRVERMPPGA